MELQLQNALQHHIADLMWEAKDREQVKNIIKIYGTDAVIVLEMMLATHYDKCTDVSQAAQILHTIFHNAK